MMKLKIIIYLALLIYLAMLNINSTTASEITHATRPIVKCFHQQLGEKGQKWENDYAFPRKCTQLHFDLDEAVIALKEWASANYYVCWWRAQ